MRQLYLKNNIRSSSLKSKDLISHHYQNCANSDELLPESFSNDNKRAETTTKTKVTLSDLEIIKTVGTGTFGRVVLTHNRKRNEYGALKVLALFDIVRLKQVDHVKNEKNILEQISHPFLIHMKWNFKDEYNIYMLFEYIAGGELFSYLRSAGRFSSSASSFYAAEIVCALEYLHRKNIVYRDLKPENLLLDCKGHIKITDFGFAKQLVDRTWTLCGTPQYLSPEVIQSKGHNRAVDFWALGILIYEMNAGFPPFFDENTFAIYEKILAGKVEFPRFIDPVAKDLVKKLLIVDRAKRLGNMKNGVEDIKRHRWFKDYNWDDVFNRKLSPPIIPLVTFEGDTNNFESYPEQTSWRTKKISKKDMELFSDF